MIRQAQPRDCATVEAVVAAAYAVYVERIGKKPGPMLDDYARLIAAGAVSVWEEADGAIAALIVLIMKADHLLLHNIAVRPDRQGQGLGRCLIDFAETLALHHGLGQLRLYTHVMMRESIALYRRLGFEETGRGDQDGYPRVFMCKRLRLT